MSGRLRGAYASKGGLVQVEFSLSPTFLIRSLEIGGVLKTKLPAPVVARLSRAFEGAALDRDVLTQVAKRAFQEGQLALPFVFPEDLVAAILTAQ